MRTVDLIEREALSAATIQVREPEARHAGLTHLQRLEAESIHILREVVAQFNRYNSIQLHVEDEELARRPISGVFNAANPESFIAFIEATTSVRVERGSDGDIVIASER